MLIFFIHGVGTENANYAKNLIGNIKDAFPQEKKVELNCYSSFWGNLFNSKKNQTNNFIEKDIHDAISKHKSIRGFLKDDVYRYRERRYEFINNFLGDFLTYQNPVRGKTIRELVVQQFFQFLQDHYQDNEIHFVAHSLGSLILWDLLFSKKIEIDEVITNFRNKIVALDLKSITTLGSPLLFLKQFLDIELSDINNLTQAQSHDIGQFNQRYLLRWINVIHSSDLIAYPLKSVVVDEVSPDIFFSDQYIWLNANSTELNLRTLGQKDAAMAIGAKDAHASYFSKSLDGEITGQIISYNLLANIDILSKKCITSWDKTL